MPGVIPDPGALAVALGSLDERAASLQAAIEAETKRASEDTAAVKRGLHLSVVGIVLALAALVLGLLVDRYRVDERRREAERSAVVACQNANVRTADLVARIDAVLTAEDARTAARFERYTEALVGAGDRTVRTPEEEAARQATIAEFRAAFAAAPLPDLPPLPESLHPRDCSLAAATSPSPLPAGG